MTIQATPTSTRIEEQIPVGTVLSAPLNIVKGSHTEVLMGTTRIAITGLTASQTAQYIASAIASPTKNR